ncbi:hypothetical protein Tco_0344031 [Tanacetum coccineum]
MLTPSGEGLILYQAYSNLYAMTGRKAHLLEDKKILSVGVFSTWMEFGGNTRDLGSFEEETDKTTTLHHILEERQNVANLKKPLKILCHEIEKTISLVYEVPDIVWIITPSYKLGFQRFNSPRDRSEKIYNLVEIDGMMASGILMTAS